MDADSVMLDKLTAAKLSYGHSSGHIDDKTLFISKIVSGKSDFVTLEFADQTISIDRDVAIVRHAQCNHQRQRQTWGSAPGRSAWFGAEAAGAWKLPPASR